MIVCSCNGIGHKDIEHTVDRLFDDDPHRLVTPVMVYKLLGKRPHCGGCMPLAAKMVYARMECLRNCHDCPLAHMAHIAPQSQDDGDEVSQAHLG